MTGARRIVGFDTGPTRHAYGIVEADEAGVFLFVGSGMVEWPTEQGYAAELVHGPVANVVVIECPMHAYSAATTGPIIATARAAGELAGFIRGCAPLAGQRRRVTTVYTTASEWRRQLLGNASAHDAAIKAWLVEHLARMPSKTNAHTRDALAMACWAAKALP